MTDPLFLAAFPDDIEPGQRIILDGDEGHHASAVKRVGIGENVLLANGYGIGVRGPVVEVGRSELVIEVDQVLVDPGQTVTWGIVQALAKGDRGELAVQMSTELGAYFILAWQAARSIVRWQGERGEKALRKWQATVREATKQSRRLRVPEVSSVDTSEVEAAIAQADVALVLHESAFLHIADIDLPAQGAGLLVIGPEGGISPEEMDRFLAAGAQAVKISDGVLRTSTAAAVALGQLDILARRC